MITVHHLNKSRSQRVLWLLEELEVPYETRHHRREMISGGRRRERSLRGFADFGLPRRISFVPS